MRPDLDTGNGGDVLARKAVDQPDIAYGLSHNNLLTASYIGTWANRPFLVMRYCAKGSSANLVGTLEPNEENEKLIWRFIRDVASGLSCLHSVVPDPIVHQDIKPDNILIDSDGKFVITDFGISKKIRSTMRSQSNRAIKAGAVAYMGPERFTSQPTSIMASDIWSLGASVYELAMGELPFFGQGGNMLRNGADMPEIDSRWSQDLNNVIKKCLAKEPWDRPKAYELAAYARYKLGETGGLIDIGFKQFFEKDKPSKIDSPDEINRRHKKRLTAIKYGVTAIVLIAISIFAFKATEQKRNARKNQSDYLELVSHCSDNIDLGSNSNCEPLLKAKDQIITIAIYEILYDEYYPLVYNKYEDLNTRLDSKLIEASNSWARAAKSQAGVGNIGNAIDYYQRAIDLYETESLKTEFGTFAESCAYMKIKDIEFRNEGENDVIDDYGSRLEGDKVKYLCARIIYDGFWSESKTVDLYVKVFNPDGSMKTGSNSPVGYSFKDGNNTINTGTDLKLPLIGWGNKNGGSYHSGTYKYEVWHDDKLLFTKDVRLY